MPERRLKRMSVEIIIDEEFKGLCPALSEKERQQLENNIIAEGCREAIILWQGILIDGHNRYEICTRNKIKFKKVQKEFKSREDVKIWIIQNQLGRRNLPAYDRARLSLQLENLFKEKAKEKQSKAGGSLHQISDEAEIRVVKELAKIAGVSHDTIHKVKTIEAKSTDEQKEKLRSGDASINEVYKTIKRAEKEEKREQKRIENAAKIEELPTVEEMTGLFQSILIDPPWDWSDEGDNDQLGRAKPDYATMTIDQLMQLPVSEYADSNCHLYLWVTNRSLPKAFNLIEQWGFRYITCITWVKPSFGMGNYFRGSTEHLLFAIKGSQPLKRKDMGTHFEAPRGKGHSKKPDKVYEIIESCSYGPYLEMFSRNDREGWKMWGESNFNL
jgi:N6-adenosine-specific RNA methylase IME4